MSDDSAALDQKSKKKKKQKKTPLPSASIHTKSAHSETSKNQVGTGDN
jgi:hypothetical protein